MCKAFERSFKLLARTCKPFERSCKLFEQSFKSFEGAFTLFAGSCKSFAQAFKLFARTCKSFERTSKQFERTSKQFAGTFQRPESALRELNHCFYWGVLCAWCFAVGLCGLELLCSARCPPWRVTFWKSTDPNIQRASLCMLSG